MASDPHARGKCIYCGSATDLTDDHIPPRSLFGKGDQGDLITVPSCRLCNNGASKDDEYFRMMLVANASSRESKALSSAQDAVIRSIERPQARGLAGLVAKSLQEVEVATKSGIYLGQTTMFKFNPERISRVVQRITRGLYWHETGIALAPHVPIRDIAGWGFPGVPSDAQRLLAEAAAMAPKIRVVGGGDFKYSCMIDGDESGWLMEFYRGVGFAVRTGAQARGAEPAKSTNR